MFGQAYQRIRRGPIDLSELEAAHERELRATRASSKAGSAISRELDLYLEFWAAAREPIEDTPFGRFQ